MFGSGVYKSCISLNDSFLLEYYIFKLCDRQNLNLNQVLNQILTFKSIIGGKLIKFLLLTEILFCIGIFLNQNYAPNAKISEALIKAEINVTSLFIISFVSLIILVVGHSKDQILTEALVIKRSRVLAMFISIPLILIGLMFWLESSNYSSLVPDAGYLGDGIFKLGAPLTFFTIQLNIFLSSLAEYNLYSPIFNVVQMLVTPILFAVQMSIYTLGLNLVVFGFSRINEKRSSDKVKDH